VTVVLSENEWGWRAIVDGQEVAAGCESRVAAGVAGVNSIVGTFLHAGARTVSVEWLDDLTVRVGD
jgi:hypothetical protein